MREREEKRERGRKREKGGESVRESAYAPA